MKSSKIKINQSIHLSSAYFSQEFCIDLDNKKIIPIRIPEQYNYRKDPFYGEKVYYMMLRDIFEYNAYLHDKFCDNAIKKEYDLSNEDCKKIMDFFNNKESNEKLFSIIDASIYTDDVYIRTKDWAELNNILKDIVDVDVLNLENIVSQSDYDFRKDGIYYKENHKFIEFNDLLYTVQIPSEIKNYDYIDDYFDNPNKNIVKDDSNLQFPDFTKMNQIFDEYGATLLACYLAYMV